MNKKILVSLSVIGAVVAITVGGTIAYFSDTETSTGNIFTAGALDLRVDSEASYNGQPVAAGTWGQEEGGLDIVNEKFFNFEDIKPGDGGENTISLHVYDNDAWGLFAISNLVDEENGKTEPEEQVDPAGDDDEGELSGEILFTAWLDQGSIPGFQNDGSDPQEGDNLMTTLYEIPFWTGELATMNSWEIADVLSAAYAMTPGQNSDGHNNYGYANGLAEDGRMVASTTYYFGLAWELPSEVGNEVQTDSMTADMTFEVQQHRNNPDPDWTPEE